jgi:NDP-sugar pyrophosphorylase family protein
MKAVIMTGGKGTRMAPYTKVLPKGLLPIGEQPILEIIVKQLAYHGFRSITMSCGYLAPLIQTYFGDGSAWNVSINYEVEDKPLGTVGPLKRLKDLNSPFLVINCDVLTTLDFKRFWKFHHSGNSLLTIASQKKEIPIDLGVLDTKEDRVINFLEKPTRSARVSMGIYVMDPQIISYIPEKQFFDIPELVHTLLADNKEIRHFENDSFWIDIGRPTEYRQANDDFEMMKKELLPNE